MKIAIINDIHIGQALIYNGKVRAASNLMEDRFEMILSFIQQNHHPDLIVNLGDIIRSETIEQDLKRYHGQMNRLKNFSRILHVIGNHELKKMSLQDIQNIWLQQGMPQSTHGTLDIGAFLFVWLSFELNKNKKPYQATICDKQLQWLDTILKNNQKPCLIFSHYALDDQNLSGNFFYEAVDNRSKAALFLYNQEEVRKVICSSHSVKAVFQAHLHYFHVKVIKNIPFITCPAMGDNICGPEVEDNIPEIYTIIDLDANLFIAKSYSRNYCFAGYETNLSFNCNHAKHNEFC